MPIVRIPVHTSLYPRRLDLNVLDGHAVDVAGVLRPDLSRGVVALQIRRGARWLTVARALTGRRGNFLVRYVPHRPISERARLRFDGAADYGPSLRPLGRLNVYRVALASWYGGGGSLACGGILTSSTMGVANKTLPCGTLVTLRYQRRIVRVPVIDRGPYVAGREFDLTEATKRALGFEGVGTVWSTS
ncbi:MAG: RlpA-like double-psi beta-barrel domain-containing protein [Solirubrobacteraceae bacterium]